MLPLLHRVMEACVSIPIAIVISIRKTAKSNLRDVPFGNTSRFRAQTKTNVLFQKKTMVISALGGADAG